ncbi:MAG: hypothetical protein JO250_07665 [Armatimonadetes bacterium]|nr:hypothetical protein [Armatimonadota bacterium]
MPDEIAQASEALKDRLARELADAPQGVRDSDMPPPPPLTEGQVGPSPTSDYVNPGQQIPPVGAGADPATGEEPDPGIANAGGTGVGDADTDGATRTGLDPA